VPVSSKFDEYGWHVNHQAPEEDSRIAMEYALSGRLTSSQESRSFPVFTYSKSSGGYFNFLAWSPTVNFCAVSASKLERPVEGWNPIRVYSQFDGAGFPRNPPDETALIEPQNKTHSVCNKLI
jgi:hypothetical protein